MSRYLFAAPLLVFLMSCAPPPKPSPSVVSVPSPAISAPSPTPYIYLPAPATKSLPSSRPAPAAEPLFELGENLYGSELKSISDRVESECDRKRLSDLACIELSHREVKKASIAQWKKDGKTWIVRN